MSTEKGQDKTDQAGVRIGGIVKDLVVKELDAKFVAMAGSQAQVLLALHAMRDSLAALDAKISAAPAKGAKKTTKTATADNAAKPVTNARLLWREYVMSNKGDTYKEAVNVLKAKGTWGTAAFQESIKSKPADAKASTIAIQAWPQLSEARKDEFRRLCKAAKDADGAKAQGPQLAAEAGPAAADDDVGLEEEEAAEDGAEGEAAEGDDDEFAQ